MKISDDDRRIVSEALDTMVSAIKSELDDSFSFEGMGSDSLAVIFKALYWKATTIVVTEDDDLVLAEDAKRLLEYMVTARRTL